MARYAYHRKDNNHDEIRDALERVGATVKPDGPTDLIVGFRGATYLIEVKTEKGKLRPTQEDFVRWWKGHVAVVRSIEEALKVIGC